MQWIIANAGTIIVCVVLIAIIALIIRSLVKNRKRGKSSCGNSCAHCAMAGNCRQMKNLSDNQY